jgi:hypothetical protein
MTTLNVLECELEIARKIFWLLKNDAIFLSEYNQDKKTWDDGAYPAINCNDLFVPGADAEKLDEEDLDLYIEAIKTYGQVAEGAWCQVKRNANLWRSRKEPTEWDDKYQAAVYGIRQLLDGREK